MAKWQCPIEDIDEDIRDVVRILYENDMKPYMSCSGSYKDHRGQSVIVQSACVEMLDSELTRELIARLINDKRFKCSISKENSRGFYGNHLPLGFRFKVEFENICGDVSKDLQSVLEDLIKGKRSNQKDRNKIDAVCKVTDGFHVSRDASITFGFNDEMIEPDKTDEDNYSITIREQKDVAGFKNDLGKSIEGFIQTQYESRFLGSDFITMLAILKRLRIEYPKIPRLKHGQKAMRVEDKSRIDKFMCSYDEKIQLAKAKLDLNPEQEQNSFESFSVEDLVSYFLRGNNDDGVR